ncbi:glutathione hydrolase 1 proenzyme-like [Mercenaria mercenaria]|uniref:glutathione hydrolase 1 proenzyme-like n=1 Tax=Mercenaria mercenaria TaxID=6596 RepID=UPI00234F0F30|nr:glutathione hydrolase 1 proenzyme-like [Mercenaria mercenaria]
MLTNTETGELLKEGDTIKLPKLGATFEKIAADPYAYYNGSLADDIAADIADGAGIVTKDDLQRYTAAVKEPMKIDLAGGDYKVLSPPPPSSGAVTLLILNILNGFNMSADSVSTGEKAVETYHRITEAFKHGFSVRTNLGDIDQEDQASKDKINELLQNMTSLSWGEMKRSKITRNTHETDYYEPTYSLTIPNAGTTHISVLGPKGDAVSITSTINLHFGSKVVGTRTGIVFNNDMDDFSTPNTTNYFGVPASPANFIKPYKRPLSSMSPTIVLDKDGDVKLVTGATGGTRIITSTALSIIQTLMLKLGLKESTEFPRIHHQLLPPDLRIEEAMPQVIFDGLKARGHTFDVREKLGSSVQAVLTMNKQESNVQNALDRKHTGIFSFSDPIRDGIADGV